MQLEIFIWLGMKFFENLKASDPTFKKQIVLRLLFFYTTVLVIAGSVYLIVFAINYVSKNDDWHNFIPDLFNIEIKGFAIGTIIGFTIGALFFFYMQWDDALKREQKLKEEKLISQYQTLKSQVNPHFLFNTLNTLSTLVYKSPEVSEQFIQKFASIYRYILDKNNEDLVTLEEELKFVTDYFYLQKFRDEEKIELEVNVVPQKGDQILPVSIQLLVENALKHNAATRKQPLLISIGIEEDYIVVKNSIQQKSKLEESSKTGLKNLSERCRLVLNREIEVTQDQKEFIVKVPIKRG